MLWRKVLGPTAVSPDFFKLDLIVVLKSICASFGPDTQLLRYEKYLRMDRQTDGHS